MPPYGSSQEGKANQRERPGEGTRPYEEFQINGYNLLSLCRALLCAEIKREAKGEPTPNGVELPSMTERS